MEALLASTMDAWPDDTEDEILAASIRKGEQAIASLKYLLAADLSFLGRFASDFGVTNLSESPLSAVCTKLLCPFQREKDKFETDCMMLEACGVKPCAFFTCSLTHGVSIQLSVFLAPPRCLEGPARNVSIRALSNGNSWITQNMETNM